MSKIKLCDCGCGKPTNIAKVSDPRLNVKKGQPYRFLHGHNPGHGHDITNRVGQRFHNFVAIALAGSKPFGNQNRQVILWKCLCDCGKTFIRATSHLLHHKSCGCLKNASGEKSSNFQHGYARRPEYRAYHGAKARCQNPKNGSYMDYGGRGIKFLYKSFDEFLKDVGDRPSSKYTLDRKDFNGNYEPGNCRWALGSVQQKNKRPRFCIEKYSDDMLLQECQRRNLI